MFGDSEIEELKKNRSNYTYHGRYKRSELYDLLSKNDIHLVCNLSICPETYSYTLTETIACGVPVLSYQIGAVGERIQKYGFGWAIRQSTKKETLDKIRKIASDIDAYNQVIDNLNNYKIKSLEEMVNFYDQLYQKGDISISNLDYLHYLLELDQKEKVIGLDARTRQLLNSKRWRLMNRIKLPESVWNLARKVIK